MRLDGSGQLGESWSRKHDLASPQQPERNKPAAQLVQLLDSNSLSGSQNDLIVFIPDLFGVMTAAPSIENHPNYTATVFKSVFEFMDDGVLVVDADRDVVAMNAAAERILGLNREQVFSAVGSDDASMFESDQTTPVDIYRRPIDLALQGCELDKKLYYLKLRDPRASMWLEVTTRQIRDENAQFSGVAVIFRDVTRTHQAQQKLRASEERFRSIIEHSTDIISVHDRTGRNLFASPALEKVLGYRPEELRGELNRELIHSEDLPKVIDTVQKALRAKGEPVSVECRVQHKNGTWRHLAAAAKNLIDQPELSGIVVHARDITERVAAQEELAKKEKQLREAQSIAHLGSWEWNLQSGEITWSPEHYNLLGLPYDVEPSYDLFMHHVHPEDRNELEKALNRSLKERSVYSHTHRMMRLDGALRWVFSKGEIHCDRDGAPIYMVGTAQDISDLKAVEEELKHYAARLERSNREMRDFAHIASHDLQEPLRKVTAFCQRIQRRIGDASDERIEDYFQRIFAATERMQNLIDDLLALARVSTRTQPFEVVNLTESTRKALVDLELVVETTQAQITVEPMPFVEADASQMQQLMLNLLANALKFQPKGQIPQIRCYSEEPSTLEEDSVNTSLEISRYTTIYVEDNGTGIPLEHQSEIFTPFQRGPSHHDYPGSGMGLAICKKIVERHSGFISIDSGYKKGARFCIKLPVFQNDVD